MPNLKGKGAGVIFNHLHIAGGKFVDNNLNYCYENSPVISVVTSLYVFGNTQVG